MGPRASRRRRSGRRPRLPVNIAFVNLPCDPDYEKLFVALIAGLSGFGLIPHVTLEIPGSERRLNRIMGLLRRCRYSFHDLSRVELDATPPETARWHEPPHLRVLGLGECEEVRFVASGDDQSVAGVQRVAIDEGDSQVVLGDQVVLGPPITEGARHRPAA